jgi:hypothetical protein
LKDIASLIVLLNFAWLGCDVINEDLLVPLSNRWSAFIFNLGWWPMFAHYVLVAFNRAKAIRLKANGGWSAR